MGSATLQGLIREAHICSLSNRMPDKLEKLAVSISQHDQVAIEYLQTAMIKGGLHERMARRAGQAAPSNVKGAERIIKSMIIIFGHERTITTLREVEYDRRIATRAHSFARSKNNRLVKARELYCHLQSLFGNEPLLEELAATICREGGAVVAA